MGWEWVEVVCVGGCGGWDGGGRGAPVNQLTPHPECMNLEDSTVK